MAESNLSPVATLIRSRCLELGLNKARLVRLAGYKNEAKGIRRLNSLIAGDLETTRWLIQGLPAALNLPTDVISGVVDQTRQQIASMKRREAEQAGMEWRENFRPHAIILTERTRPEPIFVAAIIGVERLLRVDFNLDGERKSYIKKSLKVIQRRLAKWNGTIPAFGRPTRLIVNYALNFAVRFDLRGTPQEMRADDVSETLELALAASRCDSAKGHHDNALPDVAVPDPITMSQKSSVPQAVSFVSQVLKRDTPWLAALGQHARGQPPRSAFGSALFRLLHDRGQAGEPHRRSRLRQRSTG